MTTAVRFMVDQMVALHAAGGDLHEQVYAHDLALARAQEAEHRGYLQRYFEENADQLRPMPDPELSAYVIVRAMVSLVHGVAAREPERLQHPHYAAELTELLVRFCGAPPDA
jgi:hypothetical protein